MEFSPLFLTTWIVDISAGGVIQDLWLNKKRSKLIIFHQYKYDYCSKRILLGEFDIGIGKNSNFENRQSQSISAKINRRACSARHSLRPQANYS